MKNIDRALRCLILLALFAATVCSQVGGPFLIEKSVIAGGGGRSGGSTFVLDGTIAESLSGDAASGGAFALTGGFWSDSSSAAATDVSVSGQVFTPTGAGLRNATVSIVDGLGNTSRALTSSLGFYRFDGVLTGQTYIIRVTSKRFRFAPRTISVTAELTSLNFTGQE